MPTRLEQHQAATTIQRFVRGFLARRAAKWRQRAAVRIQTAVRGNLARRKFKRLLAEARDLAQRNQSLLEVRDRLLRNERELRNIKAVAAPRLPATEASWRHSAAITVQRAVRGWIARKRVRRLLGQERQKIRAGTGDGGGKGPRHPRPKLADYVACSWEGDLARSRELVVQQLRARRRRFLLGEDEDGASDVRRHNPTGSAARLYSGLSEAKRLLEAYYSNVDAEERDFAHIEHLKAHLIPAKFAADVYDLSLGCRLLRTTTERCMTNLLRK
ncbi:hypothetical protein HK405_009144 [Cladochytrium tenue]|nr:hypothetical protein HK405_009144 [Cladochytrium tenue]